MITCLNGFGLRAVTNVTSVYNGGNFAWCIRSPEGYLTFTAALMVVIALLARLKLASWRGRVYVEGEVINVGWKKFKILGILGEGGQAFLYKVNNGTDIFAAKLALSWSPIALYHEYTVLSKLFHPNIITVHQRIPRGYIMECLSSDLCSLLENTNDLSPDLRDTISYGMIQAVGYLHSCGIAHLDIKPDNILLTTSLVPKLADFGLAKSYVNADGSVGLFNFRRGSFHYMPPEMYLRIASFDLSKSDCWSLGVCFFAMLTGVVPFSGSNDKELLSNQLNQRYDIPAKMAALIRFDEPYSRYMGMIVHLCTVDSTARFSAAEAFSFYWKET